MKAPILLLLSCMFLLVQSVEAQNPAHLSWREYETEHFIVYYPEGQEFTANNAAEIAEKVHPYLVDMYGPVDGKIHIVIRDDEDYANGGAFFYDNKVEIFATSLDYEFRSYSNWLWNVVTHELTHIYSIKQAMKTTRKIPMAYYQHIDYQEEKREDVLIGYPNVLASYAVPMFNIPSWLAEGVAQYQTRRVAFDSWDSHRDMIIRQAVLNDKLLEIDEMGIFNWTGRGNEMVYDHGFGLVRFIAETYGEEKIAEIMKALSSSTAITFDIACRRVLNLSSRELYNHWKASLTRHYQAVKDSLGELHEGETFRKSGFINGFPTWSPDGLKLAYVSNRNQDYSITSCYIANLAPGGWSWKGKQKAEAKLLSSLDKKLKSAEDSAKVKDEILISRGAFDIVVAHGIQSSPVWLDNWNILYNRRMPSDKYGSHWWDMYRYVINTKDPRKGHKKRITENLRGTYPDLSPDKSTLVFVKNSAGSNNLLLMHRSDNSMKPLTFYTDGTRLYRPRWSPDGKTIAFTIHRGSSVDIALIDTEGNNFRYIVASPGQDRDPAWSYNGSKLYFSSDFGGIPNIFSLDLAKGRVCQITNVIGGAFSPAPSPDDSLLAFSYYGPDGYEIRTLRLKSDFQACDPSLFRNLPDPPTEQTHSYSVAESSKPYRMKTLDFSIMPRFVNDRGNFKIGTYLSKSEVVDEGNFLFGGDISPTNRDSDIFALFEYKKFVPTVFVEMYRQKRSVGKNENFMEEYGTIIRKRTYDLNEVDFGLRYIYHDTHTFEGRLIYSRYNAKLEYTHYLTGQQIHKPYYTYSQGFDCALLYSQDKFIRARDEIINPRGGRKVNIRYDRFVNFFLDDFEYVGFLREKYKKYPYNRYYVNWIERIPVPSTQKHTLNLRTQISLIDRQVDEFYEEQLGGPYQMRGYTFWSLSGRKNVMAQALYRFPLVYDMKKRFLMWYFNHIYLGVFTDIGRSWNKQSLNWSTKSFKRDAGMEIRLDALSFYNFPTMIELSAAYGPDSTWMKHFDSENSRIYLKKDNQNPWKFYCTILFGFIQ